ncbi:MAG TPA: HD domain-containing phosphohydrolase, partial [Burkholderiaceae bacterium]|nr:HD domain-containing phosphohydrolase [Burkholderiaceae bacterium]
RGRQLDPALVDVALGCARELFDAIESADVWERFLEAEPQPQVCAEAARLDEIAAAIGRFGDVKSVHTLGHSAGVAAVATAAARELGLRDPELSLLRQCAHLHDLGRVGIENRIWDKRGELNRLERERVELHAVYTDRLLSRAPTWAACAQVAAAAHERFDGSGYPRRVPGPALPRLARLLAAADMAQAMREARPHRPARSPQEIAQALHAERRRGRFESEVVDAVLAGLGIGPKLPPAPHHALSEREIEVLGLVARGKTNREIAQLLGISPRTVQNHVAHVYDKIGVYSRAGAALYVMQKGLVGFG